MARLFISYAHEDRAFVETLAAALESQGHVIWFDRTLKVGARYAGEIARELEVADRVVVVWSGHSVVSDWVRDEASVATRDGKLIPLRIDDVDIPLGFGQLHTLDLGSFAGDPWHSGFQELTAAILASSEGRGERADVGAASFAVATRHVISGALLVGLPAAACLTWLQWLRSSSSTLGRSERIASMLIEQLGFAATLSLIMALASYIRMRRFGVRRFGGLVRELRIVLIVGLVATLSVTVLALLGGALTSTAAPLSEVALVVTAATLLVGALAAVLRMISSLTRQG